VPEQPDSCPVEDWYSQDVDALEDTGGKALEAFTAGPVLDNCAKVWPGLGQLKSTQDMVFAEVY
jgi:hypothetical protein